MSRSHLKKLINSQEVLIDNTIATKAGQKLRKGQIIILNIPKPKALDVKAQPIAIDTIYEDSDIIVINKHQGIVIHPSPGHQDNTLVNALLYHCNDLSGINGVMRPGIVHRLDKDTSGALVVAKNDFSHASLAAQIKQHTVLRKYHTVVHGCPKNIKGKITTPMGRHPIYRKKMAVVSQGGRIAVTRYSVLKKFGRYSLVEAQLETGRTHQVRVHMAFLGNPIVGDLLYGVKKKHFALPGQALHAEKLGLVHPRTQDYLEFKAQKPAAMRNLLKKLEEKYI